MDDEKPKRRIIRVIDRQSKLLGHRSEELSERAADMIRDALEKDSAEAERGRTRMRVFIIHAVCALLYGGALWLKYTVLKGMPEEIEGAPTQVVLLLWGAYGFPGAKAVVAHKIASLKPQALNEMLSLRPAEAGNVLTSLPPPPLSVRSPRL